MMTTTEMVLVTGKTYELRSLLADAGGVWNTERKGWILSRERWQHIVDHYGSGANKRDRARAAAIMACTVHTLWEVR